MRFFSDFRKGARRKSAASSGEAQPTTASGKASCSVCGGSTSGCVDSIVCYDCEAEIFDWARGFRLALPERLLSPRSKSSILAHLDPDVLSCYLCGGATTDEQGPDQRHIEHIEPLARGGSPFLENVGFACQRCNATKRDWQIELTPEQEARLTHQRSAFAQRYAEMKPFVEDSFDGRISLNLATAGAIPFLPNRQRIGLQPQLLPDQIARPIVETASGVLWHDYNYPPIERLEPAFLTFCGSAANRIASRYVDRGWLAFSVSDFDFDPLIQDLTVKIRPEAVIVE